MDKLNITELDMRLPNWLLEHGVINHDLYDLVASMDLTRLESHIFSEIDNYTENTDVEKLFHLIQIWGGWTGRSIYVRGGGYHTNKVMPHYKILIEACLSVHDNSENSRDSIYTAIRTFDKKVKNIGISFITKHTRFWLYKNMRENALPIYDKNMADNYMQKTKPLWRDLRPYWEQMIQQAEEEHVSLMNLERRLFNQYRN